MAAGTLTSLGMGSSLDLQNILDQLKEAERTPITAKKNEKTELQTELNAYNSLNAKMLSMKSSMRDLSLESEFLNTSASVSNEEVLSATTENGVAESASEIEVISKATRSSFQSDGVAGKDSVIYPETQSGVTNPADPLISQSDTLTVQYGAPGETTNIDISLEPGMSLQDAADAVNNSEANLDENGDKMVSAAVKNNNGEYYIRVLSASGGNDASSRLSVSDFDWVQADTSVSIGLAKDAEPAYMNVSPGTTYEEMVDIINSSSNNPGVTAAIIDDGGQEDPYRLTLTADATGEDSRMEVTNLPLTEVNGADGESLNAKFDVNGISYQRQSNTNIDDVIQGTSLTLKKEGEAGLSITKDLDNIKTNITDVVEKFNSIVSELNEDPGNDESDSDVSSGSLSALSDEFAVKNLTSQLKSLLGTRIQNGSSYTSLIDLGMEIQKDGTIQLDTATLDQALASDPDGVKQLFIGDKEAGIPGLGDTLNDGLTRMVSARGTLTTEIDETQSRIERLEENIKSDTERLNRKFETMTAEFVRLDSYINQINSEGDALDSMIESFSNSNNN